MREIVLQTRQLTKRYKDSAALDHADITVYRKDIYGLIGRNGAGKTTIMKIVTGLTSPTEGEFEIFGKTGESAGNEKRRIGCLIENPAFFPNLSAYQNLKYYCLQKGIPGDTHISETLEMVGLKDSADKKFKKFSLGMKQRLGIALAMLDDPDLIILDEPINGLDPIGISELRDTFRRLNREKEITFIISSHILSELYTVANRFLIIDKGKIIKEITKEELDLECKRCIVVRTDDTKKLAAVLEKDLGITDYKVTDSMELRIYEQNDDPARLNKMLVGRDINVSSLFESGISLEDYFKDLVEEVRS